jgi:hypothetical protein
MGIKSLNSFNYVDFPYSMSVAKDSTSSIHNRHKTNCIQNTKIVDTGTSKNKINLLKRFHFHLLF